MSNKQHYINNVFKLNTNLPYKQAIVNALKLSFNCSHFWKLLIN